MNYRTLPDVICQTTGRLTFGVRRPASNKTPVACTTDVSRWKRFSYTGALRNLNWYMCLCFLLRTCVYTCVRICKGLPEASNNRVKSSGLINLKLKSKLPLWQNFVCEISLTEVTYRLELLAGLSPKLGKRL